MWMQSSEEVYEKECGNMPGFATFYRDPNSARVTFEQYIRVRVFLLVFFEYLSWKIWARFVNLSLASREHSNIVFCFIHRSFLVWQVHWKWNSRLTRLLIQCLESEEYMEIRNGLTVLTKIASVFPVMKKSGANLERRVRFPWPWKTFMINCACTLKPKWGTCLDLAQPIYWLPVDCT